jgi:hypothetical protein
MNWYVVALQRGSANQVDHIIDESTRMGQSRGVSLCGADLPIDQRTQTNAGPVCASCLAVQRRIGSEEP